MNEQLVKTSKFLSFVLRHGPRTIGLSLDDEGWADVDELLAAAEADGTRLSRDLIREVVATSDKKRFSLSDDGQRVRANYGHSIPVAIGLAPSAPPAILYHGTATRFLGSIKKDGILSGRRNYVHLSPDTDTAIAVGQRHGRPIVLTVQSGQMHADGFAFYLTESGVWLTEEVPRQYVDCP